MNKQVFQVEVNSFFVPNKDAIMVWHRRLIHLNFQDLRHMFPSLIKNDTPSLFSCEVCQLAKHTRCC